MLTITTKITEWDVSEITLAYVEEHDDINGDGLTGTQIEKVVSKLTKDEKYRDKLAKSIGKTITADGIEGDAVYAVLDYLPASHYNRILRSL